MSTTPTPLPTMQDAITAVEAAKSVVLNDAASVATANDAASQAHAKADAADKALSEVKATQQADVTTYVGTLQSLIAAVNAEILSVQPSE